MPTPGRANLQRVRVAVEVTYCAELSGSIASFGDLRTTEPISAPADPEVLKDGRVIQYAWEKPLDVMGFRKSGSLPIKGNLFSTGEALEDGVTATKTWQSKALEAIAGGYFTDEGTAYASAGSTTGVTVSAGDGAKFLPGTIAWFETASASGIYYARKIKTRATDALTWSIALANAPASGCRILNSQLIYPTSSPSGTLQFLVEGENREEIYWFLGCNGDLTIDWKLGQFVTWGSSMMWGSWAKDTEVGTPLGGSLAAATYDAGSTVTATAGGIIFTPSAGTTLTTPNIIELSINTGIKRTQLQSFNGTEGSAGYVLTPDEAGCTITLPYDRTYETARDAGTKYQLLAQAGRTAGRQLAFEFPTLQITQAKAKNQGGLKYHELTCKALLDENTGGQTTDYLRAPWRLAQG